MNKHQFERFMLSYVQKHGDSIDSHRASIMLAQLNDEENQENARQVAVEQEKKVAPPEVSATVQSEEVE